MRCQLIFESNGKEYEYYDFIRLNEPSISEQKNLIRSFISKNKDEVHEMVNKLICSEIKNMIKANANEVPKFIVIDCNIGENVIEINNIGYFAP